ncbi:MAG: HAMP domain-containing histidine kinase, partial [Flavobacteriales bacterium]|nr:HAMP domain-containing histidine kinase [Flavobacteriales bacterium]
IGITGITSFIKKNGELDAAFKDKRMTQENLEDFIRFADQSGELVLKNLNRTASLIKTFKRIAVDQTLDSIKPIKLKYFLEDVVNSLNPKLAKKNIKIDIQCDPAVEIRSYPGALGQILINLTMNSIVHAFPDSGGGNIKIIAVVKSNKLEIQYMDDGIGIENKLLPKIFDPFVTSNRQTGSGLGL